MELSSIYSISYELYLVSNINAALARLTKVIPVYLIHTLILEFRDLATS